MIQNPRAFFSQSEKLAIDKAVAEAEKKSTGEIVPVLAGRAGFYRHGVYHAGITFAVLATIGLFGIHVALHQQLDAGLFEIPLYVLLPVQAVALVGGIWLARASWNVHRAFLPKALLQKKAELAAKRAFAELVGATKESTGIMLYVSLFERVAIVLADKGIASKCPPTTWDGVRDILIDGLKRGHGADGFVKAIEECGRILAKDFPPHAENPDELPNELRVVDAVI